MGTLQSSNILRAWFASCGVSRTASLSIHKRCVQFASRACYTRTFLAKGRLGVLHIKGDLSHQPSGTHLRDPQTFSANSAGKVPV